MTSETDSTAGRAAQLYNEYKILLANRIQRYTRSHDKNKVVDKQTIKFFNEMKTGRIRNPTLLPCFCPVEMIVVTEYEILNFLPYESYSS